MKFAKIDRHIMAAAVIAAVVSVSGCAAFQTNGPISLLVQQSARSEAASTVVPAAGFSPASSTGEEPSGGVGAAVLFSPNQVAKALEPSNNRDWSPDQALLPHAEFHDNSVTVQNIRNCTYRTAKDYTVAYYDKTFELDKIRSLDFVVVPFLEMPALAHLAMSFGFEDDQYLGVSVEIRKEKGEAYAPVKGVLNQFELMYVVADERDMIRLCTDHYLNGVYVYRAKAPPEVVRAMFVDVMRRVNQLHQQPEFYNTFTNNCTTNIVRHLNRLGTGKVPYSYQILLPGYFDRLAYDLDMIDTDLSFEETKLRARVNRLAYEFGDSPDFSARIRRF